LNSDLLKAPNPHCYQTTLVAINVIGQMCYFSQSEISFHIIIVESNFGVGAGNDVFLNEQLLVGSIFFSCLCCPIMCLYVLSPV